VKPADGLLFTDAEWTSWSGIRCNTNLGGETHISSHYTSARWGGERMASVRLSSCHCTRHFSMVRYG